MSTPKQPTKQERRDAARAARVEAEQAAAASAQKKKRLAIILGALAAVAVVAIVLIATTGGSDTAAKPDSLDSIRSFNYLGVQAHVDMGSIRANQPLEPNFQVTVTFLPQIDRDAMFASIGFGSVWY